MKEKEPFEKKKK